MTSSRKLTPLLNWQTPLTIRNNHIRFRYMTKIDLEYLSEQYEALPSYERTRVNVERVVGSLTDNRRVVQSQRDGAIKRLRQLKENSR